MRIPSQGKYVHSHLRDGARFKVLYATNVLAVLLVRFARMDFVYISSGERNRAGSLGDVFRNISLLKRKFFS